MLIEVYQKYVEYSRPSKTGQVHLYHRKQQVAILVCDACSTKFERRVRDMDHRRLSARYTHVCPDCDAKRFAQRKGMESRRFWNTTVDLEIEINSL